MSRPEAKTTVVQDTVDAMLYQYQESPNIRAWVSGFADQAQEIEYQIIAVWIGYCLPYAEGAQLDILGKIVGEARLNRDDEAYRVAIGGRIRINRGNGTIENILDALRGSSEQSYKLREMFPVALFLEVASVIDNELADGLFSVLSEIRSAGVSYAMTWSSYAESECLTLASGDVAETDPDRGLADDAGTAGGRLMEYKNDQ